MFRIPAITRVGLVAVVCVAVAAPQALAKSPAKGGRAKVVKVQKKAASTSSANVLRAGLSNAYAQGCENGTLPDRTMGGDNMNYEYYGDVCTVSVSTVPSLAGRGSSDRAAAAQTAPASDDNTNYEYYGTNGS